MKKTYTSPILTMDRFVTEDVITISFSGNNLNVTFDNPTGPLPYIDADTQNYQ